MDFFIFKCLFHFKYNKLKLFCKWVIYIKDLKKNPHAIFTYTHSESVWHTLTHLTLNYNLNFTAWISMLLLIPFFNNNFFLKTIEVSWKFVFFSFPSLIIHITATKTIVFLITIDNLQLIPCSLLQQLVHTEISVCPFMLFSYQWS